MISVVAVITAAKVMGYALAFIIVVVHVVLWVGLF
jgi:hypothetical protein